MEDGTSLVRFHNPSIRAFVLDWLANDPQLLKDSLEAATFFAQVETLCRFRSGRHHYAVNERSLRTLASAVDRESSAVGQALTRLLHSPSPGPQSRLRMGGEVSRSIEERLRFLVNLPDNLRPSAAWLTGQLEVAVQRWNDDEGDKEGAVGLINDLEDRTPSNLDAAAIAEAAAAVDAWLPKVLDETDSDWLPYLARLQRSKTILSMQTDLAEQFERHASDELDRWDPSPPHLQDLIHYAGQFALDELHQQLEDKHREETEQEEYNHQQPWRRQHPGHPRPPSIADRDVIEMFAGLTRREL